MTCQGSGPPVAVGRRVGARASDEVPNDYRSILDAVRAITPFLISQREAIEEEGRLPTEVVERLRAVGVFRMGFAENDGGPGLNSSQQLEIVEMLSYADASAGWCAMVGMDAGLYQLTSDAVSEMFPSANCPVSGMLIPAGRATEANDGYTLNGRWSMASGFDHAEWIASGAFIFDRTGAPVVDERGRRSWRVFLVHKQDAMVASGWDPTGLRGTGSVDYEIANKFVPTHHTFSLFEPTREGPLGAADALMRKMPAVALGITRAALDYLIEQVQTHDLHEVSTTKLKHDYRVQYALGGNEMRYTTMRHGVYGTLDERWALLSAPGSTLDDLSDHQRVATALARTYAMRTARQVVREVHALLSSIADVEVGPLDRWLRDTETMCQHVMSQDRIIQTCGAYLTGGNLEMPLVLGVQ